MLSKNFYKKPFHLPNNNIYTAVEKDWIERKEESITDKYNELSKNCAVCVPSLFNLSLFTLFKNGIIQ